MSSIMESEYLLQSTPSSSLSRLLNLSLQHHLSDSRQDPSKRDVMPEALTPGQLKAISSIERACSIFSLMGSVWVIVTFCLSSRFRKPINRLVFYASFGNMLTNVGTLISQHFLRSPNSPGCQFQAFLIQMFMPADAFWTLAMALNVYLTFYHKYDARELRKMDIPYLIACYGIPFVPAFVYLFVKNSQGQRPYGNATLWCWVTVEWDIWRLLTFYSPVWVIITITLSIYTRAGRTIYEKRKELIRFSSTDQDPISVNEEVVSNTKTTEVTITTEPAPVAEAFQMSPIDKRSSLGAGYNITCPSYAVHIAAGRHTSSDLTLPVQDGAALEQATSNAARAAAQLSSRSARHQRHREINNAAWAYTKSAILFFTAILITWIPSSANRVYSVVHRGRINVPLEFMSAFVLPLQGFWNAVIYTAISWSALKHVWADFRQERKPATTDLSRDRAPFPGVITVRQDRWMSRSRAVVSLDMSNDFASTTDLDRGRGESLDQVMSRGTCGSGDVMARGTT